MLDFTLPACPKLSDLQSRFLAWSVEVHNKTTTQIYRHYFERHLAALGDVALSRVSPAMFAMAARTWHSAAAAKRLFAWAVNDARVLSENPLRAMKLPPRAKRRRVITPSDQARILRHCQADMRAICLAWRETFARPGEMMRVRWSDVRVTVPGATIAEALPRGEAYFLLTEFKDANKRKHADTIRVIVISPRLGRLLGRLYARRLSDFDLCFLRRDGTGWTRNSMRCRWRRMRAALGLGGDERGEKIVPYHWRHTGATRAAAAGVRDRQLADVLGHVETRTTARYVHLSPADLAAALTAAKIWTPPPPPSADQSRKDAGDKPKKRIG